MSLYNNRYYHFNKITLSIVGQWPFQSRLESNIMTTITVLFVSTLIALQVFKDTYDNNTLEWKLIVYS